MMASLCGDLEPSAGLQFETLRAFALTIVRSMFSFRSESVSLWAGQPDQR